MPCEPHATRLPGMGRLNNGNRTGNPANAPRCGAKTRSGAPCRSAAMPNGRCRMHGGGSPGAPGTGLERRRLTRPTDNDAKCDRKSGCYLNYYGGNELPFANGRWCVRRSGF